MPTTRLNAELSPDQRKRADLHSLSVAAGGEGPVDCVDYVHDLEPAPSGRARDYPVTDRRAEVGHLEQERLGWLQRGRYDVTGAVAQLVLPERLGMREHDS